MFDGDLTLIEAKPIRLLAEVINLVGRHNVVEFVGADFSHLVACLGLLPGNLSKHLAVGHVVDQVLSQLAIAFVGHIISKVLLIVELVCGLCGLVHMLLKIALLG